MTAMTNHHIKQKIRSFWEPSATLPSIHSGLLATAGTPPNLTKFCCGSLSCELERADITLSSKATFLEM